MKFVMREKSLGGEKAESNQERSRRNDLKSQGSLIQKLHKSRQIEMCREVLRIKKALFSCRRAIQDLSRGVHSKGISMDRESYRKAIEQPKDISMDQAVIENEIKSN